MPRVDEGGVIRVRSTVPTVPTVVRRVHGFHPRVVADPREINRALVYAIWDGECIKVGKSKGDPRARMARLQTGSSRKLWLLAYTTQRSERWWHGKLWGSRKLGEWFSPTAEVLRALWDWCYLDEELWREAAGAVGG